MHIFIATLRVDMLKSKRVRIILAVSLLLFIPCFGVLVYKVYQGFLDTSKALDEHLPDTYDLTEGDSSLLRTLFAGEIKVVVVNNSTVQNPISIVNLNKTYAVVIHNFNTADKKGVKDIVHIENGPVDASTGYSYSVYGKGVPYTINFKSGHEPISGSLYLRCSGSALHQVVSTDSIVGYRFLCSDFSVRHSKDGPVDFLGITGRRLTDPRFVEIHVLFIKLKEVIKMIVVSSLDEEKSVDPNDLYNKNFLSFGRAEALSS